MSADPALFAGKVDADGVVHLDAPLVQRAYCKRRLAGKRIEILIAEQGELKTRAQEQGFHAMIRPWADAEGHRVDDLKRDLLREVFGERDVVNAITGEVSLVLREPHTSPLSRKKYSELIERTAEIAARCGHLLQLPHEYTEWKRAQDEKAYRKAQAADRRAAAMGTTSASEEHAGA